jgi:hypothetical protein
MPEEVLVEGEGLDAGGIGTLEFLIPMMTLKNNFFFNLAVDPFMVHRSPST